MRFEERKEFHYDPEVFRASDTSTALRIYKEYIVRHSPKVKPKFFEVDRKNTLVDPLWHMPKADRTQYSREIEMPCVVIFEKPDWRLTKLGIIPQRRDTFLLSNLVLQELDYFPLRGDGVYYNGYRYMILNVEIPNDAYWQQTNIWMGLSCTGIIPPDGDALPLKNLGQLNPAEKSTSTP